MFFSPRLVARLVGRELAQALEVGSHVAHTEDQNPAPSGVPGAEVAANLGFVDRASSLGRDCHLFIWLSTTPSVGGGRMRKDGQVTGTGVAAPRVQGTATPGQSGPEPEIVASAQNFSASCQEPKGAQDKHHDFSEHGGHLLSKSILHPPRDANEARNGTRTVLGARSRDPRFTLVTCDVQQYR